VVERWPYNSGVGAKPAENKRNGLPPAVTETRFPRGSETQWLKSVTEFSGVNAADFAAIRRKAADAALGAYLRVMALGMVRAIGGA